MKGGAMGANINEPPRRGASDRGASEGYAGRVADGILAVNIRALRIVLEHPGYRLLSGRYGLRALPEEIVTRASGFTGPEVDSLLETAFMQPSETVLTERPGDAVAWIAWAFTQERQGYYPLKGLVAKRGRIYAE